MARRMDMVAVTASRRPVEETEAPEVTSSAPDLLEAARATDELVKVCSWCRRWWDGTRWTSRELEEELVSHGMCPACEEAMDMELDDMTPVSRGRR